jgi:hypothetical protein
MTVERTVTVSGQPGPLACRPSFLGRLSRNPWSALAVLMCGTFMFVLDFFIVNVALPSIQQGLRADEVPSSGW